MLHSLLAYFLPNQRLIRIDRRRRMIYVKDDQFYIHQLPEWTVYDDIEKVNLPLFLSHEGLHFRFTRFKNERIISS